MLAVGAFAGLGLLAFVGTAMNLLSQPPPDELPGIIGGAVFLLLSAHTAFTRLFVRKRGSSAVYGGQLNQFSEHGALIPYSKTQWFTALGFLTILTIVFVLMSSTSWIAIIMAIRYDGAMIFQCITSTVLSLVASWFCWQVYTGRIMRGYLFLTPTGILHRSWGFTSFFPWDSLVSVTPVDPTKKLIYAGVKNNASPAFARHATMLSKGELAFRPHMGLFTTNLAVDPALTYHAVRYYFENPDKRAELGTQDGVRRLRDGDLLDG